MPGADAGKAPARTPAPSTNETVTGRAADLVAEAVAALHANGAGSARSEARAAELARALGATVTLDLGWSRSSLTLMAPGGQAVDRTFRTPPAVIGMNRVLAVDTVVNRFGAGTLGIPDARSAVGAARALPASNLLLFAAACAAGAGCLALLFGAEHPQTVALIAISAAVGAFLRRGIAAAGGSNFWQVGLAALLAGLLGALATNLGISSALGLAALCPCMILVPGPHLLNGSLDLAALRIPLGLARLAFATLTLLAIGAGLLAGLTLGGAALSVDPAGRDIPLWLDAPVAGLVAVCYGVFYSAPLRILAWPFVVGSGVHALRWVALDVWHLAPPLGAGLACLVAASVLMPVSRRLQLPFSAIGFASVVSLMPGVLIFRALAGLAELPSAAGAAAADLLVVVVNDANSAWLTVFAMALGFLVPAGFYAALARRREAGS